jgi:hypothetical protein
MPKRVDFDTQVDFTGGLNLATNPSQLDKTETPDCLNVDLDPRGGFALRRGVDRYLSDLAGVAHSLLPFITSGGTAKVLAGVGTALYHHDGASWTSIFTGGPAGPYRSTTFKDRIYVVSGNNSVRRWDGTTATTLSDPSPANWNDSIGSPTVPPSNGRFPKASVAAAYMGSVFVGNITEGSTAYPCRVRWSHPLFPEDWRALDYIDIEPEDGDEITALVPMGDRLIVFKRNSIHAIYGAPPESLTVTPISREVGAPSQEAVASSDIGVFFWHEQSGAQQLTPDGVEWIGDRLFAAIEDGRISDGRMDEAMVGWLNRRLWVSVPYEGSSTLNRTFVFDPFASKKGAWTQYDLEVGPFLNFVAPGQGGLPLAAAATTAQVVQLDVHGRSTDRVDGSTATHIDAHYVTRWWDNGQQVVRKRWKRPEVLLLGGQETQVTVDVYRDWDLSDSKKSFHLTTTLDGTEATWDVSDWDEVYWAGSGQERGELEKGSPLGNARAVALRFQGPATDQPWRVDALTMKWVSKRVRN